jgi:toxin ParE1/3/4
MKVVIAEAARSDLIAIGEFIQQQNPVRAITFVNELLNRCNEIADMPRAYPLVPRYERWGVRRRVYQNYLIFYRIREELIEIIHILNGAQDYEVLLFPDA